MGGTIAYEAAQQLYAEGEEVALLALFDTMNWNGLRVTGWNKIFRIFQRLFFHAAVLFEIDAEGRRQFLKGKFYDLRKRLPVWRGMLMAKLGGSSADDAPVPRSGASLAD